MCIICDRVKMAKEGSFATFVHEFDTSILVIGEHQYFQGYCVLHHKNCVSDITELSGDNQQKYFSELMEVTVCTWAPSWAAKVYLDALGCHF